MTHTNNNQAKHYHQLTIIQKVNVKANIRAYGERFAGQNKNHMIYVAAHDLRTWQYDTPFYFNGSNPLY